MHRISLLIVSSVVLASTIHAPAAMPESVRVGSGLVSGAALSGGVVRAFKGIPYAAPPVGSLRWRPPQPPASWDGVRKSDDFGPRCLQGSLGGPGRQGPPPPVGKVAQASGSRQIIWAGTARS